MGPRLSHPKLWGFNRRSVARGMAIGVFFAFVIPLAQAPAAGVTALFLRSNLPVALASTLVSNPLTYAPIYYDAYRVGNALLPPSVADPAAGLPRAAADQASSLHLGKALALGLTLFASLGSLLAYATTHLLWRWLVMRRWRHRKIAALR